MTPLVHLDADAFFASVEQSADPRLRGIPIAVGGRKRGIIASASYQARQLGVYTPMPTQRALQLCPELVVVPGNFEMYEQFSDWIFDMCEDLTPLVERSSIDEGYMDFSGTWNLNQEGLITTVQKLDKEIHSWLKITLSEGMATNKVVSAVASKLHKPNGFLVVPEGSEAEFMGALPLSRMPGIGPKTTEALRSIGARRIEDLTTLGVERLHPFLGKTTDSFLQLARGIDDRRIVLEREPAKSYGQQNTFAQDIGDEEEIIKCLKTMVDDEMIRMRDEGKQARTLNIKIRYTDMEETETSRSLYEPSNLENDFYPFVAPMLKKLWQRRVHLRLAAVRFTRIYDAYEQLEFFDRKRQRLRKLNHVVDQINETYGQYTVQRAYRLGMQIRSGTQHRTPFHP
ncbi:MAG: DNA polymerase IV [Opitutaceae bacterium]|nr:DNA polymerase IV [Opitutaceae bacterium]